MIDGKTPGIAIKPLGSISASFYAMEEDAGRLAARLLFNVESESSKVAVDGRTPILEDRHELAPGNVVRPASAARLCASGRR